jgi:hypothetical protein
MVGDAPGNAICIAEEAGYARFPGDHDPVARTEPMYGGAGSPTRGRRPVSLLSRTLESCPPPSQEERSGNQSVVMFGRCLQGIRQQRDQRFELDVG